MSAPESIGALLARVRLARGWSQLRLAEMLCAASGQATITRHEVSRWEREERIPTGYWLGCLAAVLDVAADELAGAAAVARARRAKALSIAQPAHSPPPGNPACWLDQVTADLPGTECAAAPQLVEPGLTYLDEWDARLTRLAELRRMDDLVGGLDLAALVERELRVVLTLLGRPPSGRRGRQLLQHVAELAQLAGWTAADAGQSAAATQAYHLGLSAAAGAGDRALMAHLLGCLSQLAAHAGNHREALLHAQTGHATARRAGSAGLQALLLHRLAYAAALAGKRRLSEEALVRAERMAHRRDPARDPSWLYWLDEDELTALSGRCFAALRRPLRAAPLLCQRLATLGPGTPRTRALDGGALIQAYLDAGEPEQALAAAETALLDAVRSGSARATVRVLKPASRLATGPTAARYADVLAAVRRYLPGVAASPSPERIACSCGPDGPRTGA